MPGWVGSGVLMPLPVEVVLVGGWEVVMVGFLVVVVVAGLEVDLVVVVLAVGVGVGDGTLPSGSPRKQYAFPAVKPSQLAAMIGFCGAGARCQ